jgi:uncharacterized protein VirK/YbjX
MPKAIQDIVYHLANLDHSIPNHQKQKFVATSSTHAEIRALYTFTLDIIYIVHLCEELERPIDLPAIVFEDNQPVIDLTKTLSSKVT